MREMAKRTAVAALVGVTAMSMLAGCGEKNLDGTKTVATVNGTDIPLGIVSLSVRQQQAQTEAMYLSLMGSQANIWDTEAEEGVTYGEQLVDEVLQDVELMYIMREKAPDYGIEVTEEDETAIAEAAASFMEANDEETIQTLAVDEDMVKTLLELETYRERIYDPVVADVDTEMNEDEVQQSSFTYVSINFSSEELTDEEVQEKKDQAQDILDKMLEDPSADMDEIAKESDDTYSALSGTFTTNESDNDEVGDTSYPDEVIEALRTLEDGEVYDSVVGTDTNCYILRLDEKNDEEATETKKESIISTRESNLYLETTQGWLDEADITENEDVLSALTVTNNHTFTIQTAEDETEAAEEDTSADTAEEETTEEDTAAEEETTESDIASQDGEEESSADSNAASQTEESTGEETTEADEDTQSTDTEEDTADTEGSEEDTAADTSSETE